MTRNLLSLFDDVKKENIPTRHQDDLTRDENGIFGEQTLGGKPILAGGT